MSASRFRNPNELDGSKPMELFQVPDMPVLLSLDRDIADMRRGAEELRLKAQKWDLEWELAARRDNNHGGKND